MSRCYSLNDKKHKSCNATEYFLHQERKEAYLAIQPCIYTVQFLLVDAIRTLAGQLRSATSHVVCR